MTRPRILHARCLAMRDIASVVVEVESDAEHGRVVRVVADGAVLVELTHCGIRRVVINGHDVS